MRLQDITRNLRIVARMHGPLFPLVVIQRAMACAFYKTCMSGTFELGGRRYPYFYHLANATFRSERCVELPIARAYCARFNGRRILEVGNVLNHYRPFPHDVVDKYETADQVYNEDVVDYKPPEPYDLIVSVSTLEHVGWDETPREPYKVKKAVMHLASLLAAGGTLVVTMPLGYNDHLDELVRDGALGLSKTFF